MLGNESKSTQIRIDFMRKIKLKGKTKFPSTRIIKGKTKFLNISSIKDPVETIITAEAELQVADNSNTLSFAVREANTKGKIQNPIATSTTKVKV